MLKHLISNIISIQGVSCNKLLILIILTNSTFWIVYLILLWWIYKSAHLEVIILSSG